MEMCLRDLLEIQELTDIISYVFYWCAWKNDLSEHDDVRSGGGYPLPLNSTTEALVLLGATDDVGSKRATYQVHDYSQALGRYPIRVRVWFRVRFQLPMEQPHELRIIIK